MNKMKVTVLLAAMGFAGIAWADSARVSVTWAPTEKLTEVKQNPMQRGQMRPQDWERELTSYVQRRADKQLPEGQRLDVTVDDIKLAGDYEPWHTAQAQDIRFMKDIYPPRVELHYRLIGTNGQTLREGSNKLLGLGYMERPLPTTDTDPLRFDKRLFDDWLRKEFRDNNVAER
jgi:Protein of unknown function (DUF3016)